MKKKSFGLAAAVAVLIVLGGSYTLLANHNRIQESESAAAESETGVAVATIASDKVSSFQLADGDTSFTLTKTDNSWICVQDETFPLSNDAASELVNTFTSLQAVRDLGTAQDGENYGFSENAPTVTLTSSDSTNCSFVLGEANSMTGDYYLKREDSGEIYTVSSSLADSFHKTLTDLAEIESFPTISSDNVQELSITKEGTTLLFESSTTGSVKTWQISQSQDGGKTESTPEKATVNTVTTLVDHLGNLSFDSFVDHKEENKEKYGLKNPSMTINFQYTEATNSDDATTEAESETDTSSETESETANETEPAEILSGTLYVGEQEEDGSYYVQLDGSNNIYLMSADKLSAFQGLNYDDYPESEEESTESETSAE